jgi:hypothetical protein
MTTTDLHRRALVRRRDSHIFAREPHGHYVERPWCSERLFAVEPFDGTIIDPCAGWGQIPQAAMAAGYRALAADIVDRGAYNLVTGLIFERADFLKEFPFSTECTFSIVCNPPFDQVEEFAARALALCPRKVAMICQIRRLPAAHWLQRTPLYRIYLLTPRPSMPPGTYIEAGGKPQGDRQDYVWLVWLPGYEGASTVRWLHRDAGAGSQHRAPGP